MTKDNLSSEVSYATRTNTTPDVPSVGVEWEVENGEHITLRENEPVILKATDTNGDPLPADTKIGIAKTRPSDELGVGDLFTSFSIRPFNALSLSEQQSGENAQRRKPDFDPNAVSTENNGTTVHFNDSDKIKLYILSSVEVDGSSIRFSYPARIDD